MRAPTDGLPKFSNEDESMASTKTNAPDEPLTAEARAHFEKRLLEERRRALRELNQLGETFGASLTASDGDLTNYPFHMADQGTDTMEQEKNFLLASQEGRLLWNIDEALRRLYRSPETFGRCESCGDTIAFERLDALPYTRTCISCKQRDETSARTVTAVTPSGDTGSDADGAPAAGAGTSAS